MMKASEERFLEALRAALRNGTVDWAEEIPAREWGELFQMAQMHKVQPMIYEAVISCPAAQRLDPAALEQLRRQTVEQVMYQAVKTEEFLRLIGHLKEKGITPLVFKGILCRSMYPKPDHRLSSDEDILIPAEQFPACHEAMESFGMRLVNPEKDIFQAYEVSYITDRSPLYIELHKSLFEPESDACKDFNCYFEDVFERAVQVTVQGASVLAMECTDYLFYLICHAFKHFIHCGVGIRQMCDIMLFADAYHREIDWMRIGEQCRALHAEIFAAALFRIGGNYLGFGGNQKFLPEEWSDLKVDEAAMLEDALCGGVYGSSSMSRKYSSSLTVHAVENQKAGKKKNMLIQILFPSAESMLNRYPYLKNKKWLLPAAWIKRICKYSLSVLPGHHYGNSASAALKIGRERIGLMKQYGIMR